MTRTYRKPFLLPALLMIAALWTLAASADAQLCDDGDNTLFALELGHYLSEMHRVADQAEALGVPAGTELRRPSRRSRRFHPERRLTADGGAVRPIRRLAGHRRHTPAAQRELGGGCRSDRRGTPLGESQDPTRAGDGCPVLPTDVRNGLFIANVLIQRGTLALQTLCDSSQCVQLLCKVTCPLAGVAETAALVLQAILDLDDYCFGVQQTAVLRDFAELTGTRLRDLGSTMDSALPSLDVDVSSIASQTAIDSLADDIEQGLDQATDDTSAWLSNLGEQSEQLQAFQAHSLRHRIERALRDGNDGRIVSFQLPGSAGGRLEAVRELTAETIHSSGSDPSALELFNRADEALNQNRYNDAYTLYREAYRVAVAPPRSES